MLIIIFMCIETLREKKKNERKRFHGFQQLRIDESRFEIKKFVQNVKFKE